MKRSQARRSVASLFLDPVHRCTKLSLRGNRWKKILYLSSGLLAEIARNAKLYLVKLPFKVVGAGGIAVAKLQVDHQKVALPVNARGTMKQTKQTKDAADEQHEKLKIIQRTNRLLSGKLGEEARQSIKDWLAAWEKAQKLRRHGYDVSIPPPQRGRPQLLLIGRKARVRHK